MGTKFMGHAADKRAGQASGGFLDSGFIPQPLFCDPLGQGHVFVLWELIKVVDVGVVRSGRDQDVEQVCGARFAGLFGKGLALARSNDIPMNKPNERVLVTYLVESLRCPMDSAIGDLADDIARGVLLRSL